MPDAFSAVSRFAHSRARVWALRMSALAFLLALVLWWVPLAVVRPSAMLGVLGIARPAWWLPSLMELSECVPFLAVAALSKGQPRRRGFLLLVALVVLAQSAWRGWQACPLCHG